MYQDKNVSREKVYIAVKTDPEAPYPRICAHRGFNTVAPENSLAAFASAIALGAPEIELDVRFSKDGVPVIAHDSLLERVSNGTGNLEQLTIPELKKLDFGGKFNSRFAGMPIVLLEEVLERFARQVIINLHLKTAEKEGDIYPEENMKKILSLLEKYDNCRHIYWMGDPSVMACALKMVPEIPRCMGAFPGPWEIIDHAIEFQCAKAQLFTPYFNKEMIAKAHANGIRCNFFYCDDPEEARKLFALGIDTLLTNDYWSIAESCKDLLPVGE